MRLLFKYTKKDGLHCKTTKKGQTEFLWRFIEKLTPPEFWHYDVAKKVVRTLQDKDLVLESFLKQKYYLSLSLLFCPDAQMGGENPAFTSIWRMTIDKCHLPLKKP